MHVTSGKVIFSVLYLLLSHGEKYSALPDNGYPPVLYQLPEVYTQAIEDSSGTLLQKTGVSEQAPREAIEAVESINRPAPTSRLRSFFCQSPQHN